MKVKVFDGGYMPEHAHFDDAGYDLRTPIAFTLMPLESMVIDVKVAFQIPIGWFGELKSKSGLNVNFFVESCGGVLDASYRGSIKARIKNTSKHPYTFYRGDKICQVVFQQCGLFDLEQVDELDPSVSGRDADAVS